MNFLTKILESFDDKDTKTQQATESEATDSSSCSSFSSDHTVSSKPDLIGKERSKMNESDEKKVKKLLSAENLHPLNTSIPPKFHRCVTLSSLEKTSRNMSPRVCTESFQKLKVLGIGSFGKVLLVKKRQTNSLYAMKIVKKKSLTPRMKTRIKMERNVMALHRHPFIVKLHHAFQQDDKLFFVMDYCAGGDLYYHLHPSRSSRRNICGMAKFVTAQLTLALGHLHNHGIIYRDLKPENVLFDSKGYIKLADFGLTKGGVFDSLSGAKSICGSLHYMAPEVLLLNERGPNAEYGTAADWWGLGESSVIFRNSPYFDINWNSNVNSHKMNKTKFYCLENVSKCK
mmetsp:Transcript_25437/g.33007  ORF Transcript_25437/g.33007 Transcript_25437/m.33007 type:complete len:343 (-) Transcript_25437:1211-2239(-)